MTDEEASKLANFAGDVAVCEHERLDDIVESLNGRFPEFEWVSINDQGDDEETDADAVAERPWMFTKRELVAYEPTDSATPADEDEEEDCGPDCYPFVKVRRRAAAADVAHVGEESS